MDSGDGKYSSGTVVAKLADAGDRSAGASISRTLARLERRGLIRRHGQIPYRFFTLTETGLEQVNWIRRAANLKPLVQTYQEQAPVTDEELAARRQELRQELRRDWAELAVKDHLRQAVAKAAGLELGSLEEVRAWIIARLDEVLAQPKTSSG
jgi:hypothetical protein